MLILLSPAKTMNLSLAVEPCPTTIPQFEQQAKLVATLASAYSAEALAATLKIPQAQAEATLAYYRTIANASSGDEGGHPAILHYAGVVYKHLHHQGLTHEELLFAQAHLRITSFMYGLLRPLDAIRPYRMEGSVRLEALDKRTIFDFWKSLLTDTLLEDVEREGGVLINLASAEMKKLFQWRRIEQGVTLITPEFKIYKNGTPKNVVVYTKMARGEMARYIIQNRLVSPEALKDFTWEGFRYHEALSTEASPLFTAPNLP